MDEVIQGGGSVGADETTSIEINRDAVKINSDNDVVALVSVVIIAVVLIILLNTYIKSKQL